jgi:hypothetical protein
MARFLTPGGQSLRKKISNAKKWLSRFRKRLTWSEIAAWIEEWYPTDAPQIKKAILGSVPNVAAS